MSSRICCGECDDLLSWVGGSVAMIVKYLYRLASGGQNINFWEKLCFAGILVYKKATFKTNSYLLWSVPLNWILRFWLWYSTWCFLFNFYRKIISHILRMLQHMMFSHSSWRKNLYPHFLPALMLLQKIRNNMNLSFHPWGPQGRFQKKKYWKFPISTLLEKK